MLDIRYGALTRTCDGVGRRDFLRVGTFGLLGLSAADWLALRARGEVAPAPRARSVIQLWMGGGPSQIDTFDPKPDAPEAITGPLRKPVQTKVPGTFISQLLPKLAEQADKFTILRGMTHGNNSHETATYMMMTCTSPTDDVVYPTVGSVVAQLRAPGGSTANGLPPYVTLTQPLGRISEAGFLGSSARSFATGGDPNSKDFRVQGLVPPRGATNERIQQRRGLVATLDAMAREVEDDPASRELDAHRGKAYDLILGDARKAFDLSGEKDELRDRYGRNPFGQSCLLARRLVEHGVPFVTINMGGWDTHTDNFGALEKRQAPTLDGGFATLLADLADRGLLDSTIVLWYGEFGRTPQVQAAPPWFGGRHHFGAVFSAVVAGGGFQGGHVLGSSDARGERLKDRPIYPWDLSASMYQLLGIDPMGRLPHPLGCVAHVTPLSAGDVPTGGVLKEIM
ncbi:DUF1501 domain-containing protein [Paludisphaera rhizosphaerae]|uniref:DUF1501 domain-containing protein n=1 Tax=Paludisphaera rhizosphaerae TaxID=2711216 RepID=UPI0013E9AE6B|nr:DUF1501 domain-containing protein [Paludisphaera rhizosphaerae]